MRPILPFLFSCWLCCYAFGSESSQALPGDLAQSFQNPPATARPGALWYWRHELHTKEGITADLEAMARVGISELLVGFMGAHDVPVGDVGVLSPKWWEMMRHTACEANRLGVKLRFFNSPGWSSTGGPWITPEMSMQTLVWSQLRVMTPGKLAAPLPHPPEANTSTLERFTKEYAASIKPFRYLGDVAVIAFPTPKAERWNGGATKFSCADPQFRPEMVGDGNEGTVSKLANPQPQAPVYLQTDYEAPFPARSLTFLSRDSDAKMLPKQIQVERSEDGLAWQVVGQWSGPAYARQPLNKMFKAPAAKHWRMGLSGNGPFTIAEMALSPAARVEDWTAKVMKDEYGTSRPPFGFRGLESTEGEAIASESILDLTDRLQADGTLNWEVPPGDWTILRFGRIPALKANAPAAPSGAGLECDKYNPAAVDLHWRSFVAPLLADKDLNAAISGVHIDSYEKGSQTWSPCLPLEFQKRAGYDFRRFLPVLTGRVIDNIQSSERFLWDWRKTLCDTMADNYYGRMAQLAANAGKILSIEPYHQTQFDTQEVGTRGNAVMTEFHLGGVPGKAYFKNAASPAHVAGIKCVEAESFTSMPQHGGNWTTAPWDMKGLGDLAFCAGVNRYMFHVSNQQPWLDITPGVASPWGQHIERTNTWFDFSYDWMRYIARCQNLLQQGRFVADYLVSTGENSPNQNGVKLESTPGYEFDLISPGSILKRLQLKDGLLSTDGLADYAPILVLPPEEPCMTAAMVGKLTALVEAGMTLVGPRPEFSPTLKNRAQEDVEFQKRVKGLWGNLDGKNFTVNKVGKGTVVWGKSLSQILAEHHRSPQFVGCGKSFTHIFRQTESAEIWMVANTSDEPGSGDCLFRSAATNPELWDPITGHRRSLTNWRAEKGTIIIPMRFEPRQSWFVVFTKGASAAAKSGPSENSNFPDYRPIKELAGAWEVEFAPQWFYPDDGSGGKLQFDQLIDWTKHPLPAVRHFSGTAVYRKSLELNAETSKSPIFLELGEFKGIAEVHLNNQNLGTVWCAPWRVEISRALRSGRNALEIRMANCWANRLIGDEQLPADAEFNVQGVGGGILKSWPKWLLDKNTPRTSGRRTFSTYKHWNGNEPLLGSGLLGPVRVFAEVTTGKPSQ